MERKEQLTRVFARSIRDILERAQVDFEQVQEIGLRVRVPLLRGCGGRGGADRAGVAMAGENLLTDSQGGKNAGLDTAWFDPRGLPGEPAVVPTWEADGFPALRALILGDGPHTNASTQIT